MNNKKVYSTRRGFTLIEVLIVVSIIGILASIVLVGLGAFRSRGRDTRRLADVRQMQGAFEIYYTKTQQYPPQSNWDQLAAGLKSAQIGIDKIPNDPLPGRTYWFGVSSSGQNYVIGAQLEDVNHPSLRDDIDPDSSINTFGVDCTDPVYCVQF